MREKIKKNLKEYLIIFFGVILGVAMCFICDSYVEKESMGRPIIQVIESLTRIDRYGAIVANLILFILGNIVVDVTMGEEEKWTKRALSYPVGVLLWIACSIVCLVIGIPYNAVVMGVILLGGVAALVFFSKKSIDVEKLIRESGLFLVLAIILSSGIARNIVGNDTTYYNENYGYWLVEEGRLGKQLLVPMAITGMSTPTLCSYFKMWNVDNIYLAQNIFRCVFIVFFYKAIGMVCTSSAKKKLAIAGTFLLVTSPAYTFVASWIISNSFMMFEMLMLAVCLWNLSKEKKQYVWLAVILTFVVSFTRVEGAILSLFVVVCALNLHISKRDINLIAIPSIIGQTIYQLRCLKYMKDVPNELFVSKSSIIILLAFMAMVFVLIQVINRKWAKIIKANLGYIIVVLGALGTVGLCILDYEKYAYNLKMTLTNITYLGMTGSWGMTPLLLVICLMLIIVKLDYSQYWDTMWIAYFVLILAICWSRESVLRVSFADSGNRISIQILPILVMALLVHVDKIYLGEKNEKNK